LLDLLHRREPQAWPAAWGLKELIWGSVLGLALFLGSVVLAAVLSRFLQPLGSGAASVRSAPLALTELTLLMPVWLFAARRPAVGWCGLGLRGFRALPGCLGAAALLYVSLSVNLIWGLVLHFLGWAGQPDVLPLFGQGPAGLALAFLATGIVAPFVEELFFRGFAYPPLRRRFGPWWGMAISAGLFTALHFTPTVFPPIFLLGVFFCLLYEYTGSLWPGMILHASINTLSVLAAYLLPR